MSIDCKKNNKILILVPVYLPGFRAGGPIRSIASLVELLGDEFDFKIITSDRDLGMKEPYEGIIRDTWCKVGKAEVYYASKANLGLLALSRFLRTVDYQVLYCNSFFSLDFTIKPLLLRYLKLIPKVSTIVAPRGEFSLGALKLKWLKKRFYIYAARMFGLYSDLIWQASSKFEENDIRMAFVKANVAIAVPIIVAPDLASLSLRTSKAERYKQPGKLNIVFLSRISPKKNLDGALSMLRGAQGDITFNIFGPTEDSHYLHDCQNICRTLNSNIKVFFHGEVDHEQVQEIFCEHHLFFFPTHGENFGHVILEALLAGCQLLISDQTPWRDLQSSGIGWDLPLDNPDEFRTVLEHYVKMDDTEFLRISKCSKDFGKSILSSADNLDQNRELFQSALSF